MTWYCLQNIGSHGHCEPIFSVISPTERKQKVQKPWWGWLRMPLATIILNKTHLKHFCIQLLWSFSSVQCSHSVACDSLRPHALRHSRPPCPSPTPRAYWNSCPLIGDVIQPSHPLWSPPLAFNLSQHQGLFKWVSSSHEVAKVLEFQLQHQSFQWTPRTDLL